MKVTYRRTQGKQLVYDITADRWGRYSIHLGEKFLWSAGMALGMGQRPGKRREEEAIATAKAMIEELRGMPEE